MQLHITSFFEELDYTVMCPSRGAASWVEVGLWIEGGLWKYVYIEAIIYLCRNNT